MRLLFFYKRLHKRNVFSHQLNLLNQRENGNLNYKDLFKT